MLRVRNAPSQIPYLWKVCNCLLPKANFRLSVSCHRDRREMAVREECVPERPASHAGSGSGSVMAVRLAGLVSASSTFATTYRFGIEGRCPSICPHQYPRRLLLLPRQAQIPTFLPLRTISFNRGKRTQEQRSFRSWRWLLILPVRLDCNSLHGTFSLVLAQCRTTALVCEP